MTALRTSPAADRAACVATITEATLPCPIRVGLAGVHSMAREASAFGPVGVQYSFLSPIGEPHFVRSPIKGYLRRYETNEHHLVEAVLAPILTSNRWVYSVENLQAAAAFNVLGCPVPRRARVAYLQRLFGRHNCRRLVFWSEAGKRTLQSYGHLDADDPLLQKSAVVYPAVREVADAFLEHSAQDGIMLLFSGDFFRKGGVNVVDAFERAQRLYDGITLTVCCEEQVDFNTADANLRSRYLAKLHTNPGIRFLGRIPRDRMLHEILPRTDVYFLPTYAEAFGMAILEAMAYAIPVVATNHTAIPEMIEDGVSGLLIDTGAYDLERMFRGYTVDHLPEGFREFMTDEVFSRMCRLIESRSLRRQIGMAAAGVARSRFSFRIRNAHLSRIYQEALN